MCGSPKNRCSRRWSVAYCGTGVRFLCCFGCEQQPSLHDSLLKVPSEGTQIIMHVAWRRNVDLTEIPALYEYQFEGSHDSA